MICYFHSDLDGRCAAAIVLKRYPDCRLREVDYKDNPNFYSELNAINHQPGREKEMVFIVDFSFKPEKMNDLFSLGGRVVWIDHHKTAKDYNYAIPGLRDFSEPGKSGCELTWEYLYTNKPMPEAVRLLGDYDTWRFDTREKTLAFQEGMKGFEDTSPNTKTTLWETLLDSHGSKEVIDNMIYKGNICIGYRKSLCDGYRKAFGYSVLFENEACYALNLYRMGSHGFGEEINNYSVCIAFAFSDKKWTVGLYSKTVDVSVIAKKYGGGGHSGAAGFICDELPF